MWCNYKGMLSQPERPNRIRLPDGSTKTSEEVTDELLAQAGWFWEVPIVSVVTPQDPSTATNITIE